MQLSLAERTVLVTGGGSGIGKGAAAAVVAAGGNAMLVGRNADKLSAAADEIKAQGGPGSVLYEPADVTNEDEVARAVEAATAWTGTLHGVVHCAGGSETIGPVTQIDSEAWRRTVSAWCRRSSRAPNWRTRRSSSRVASRSGRPWRRCW